MVAAAKLVFDFALPTEEVGTNELLLPDREIKWVRRLFEKAIGGFYEVMLKPKGWQVQRGRRLNWQFEQKTPDIEKILPTMQTDVILDHPRSGQRIVIDTKFTAIVTPGWFRAETLRSGYLYQIYAYLRSQTGCGDVLADSASGLLLHPAIGQMFDETVMIQGHHIRFATVDLSATTATIRAQLLKMCESKFK